MGDLEKIKAWAKRQMEYAETFRRAFDSKTTTSDAVDTAEYHLGYRDAMHVVLLQIEKLQSDPSLDRFMKNCSSTDDKRTVV